MTWPSDGSHRHRRAIHQFVFIFVFEFKFYLEKQDVLFYQYKYFQHAYLHPWIS